MQWHEPGWNAAVFQRVDLAISHLASGHPEPRHCAWLGTKRVLVILLKQRVLHFEHFAWSRV